MSLPGAIIGAVKGKKKMTVEIKRVADVLVVRLAGPISLDELMRSRAAAMLEWKMRPVKACVVDARDAFFDVDEAGWNLVMRTGERWGFVDGPPAAYVVAPELVPEFRARGLRWATLGAIRTTFTDFNAALAWGQARREMVMHQPL